MKKDHIAMICRRLREMIYADDFLQRKGLALEITGLLYDFMQTVKQEQSQSYDRIENKLNEL